MINNKTKYFSSFLFVLFFITTCSQSNDTVFIKKDKYQNIYIVKDRNSEQYNSLINYSNFDTTRKIQKIEALGLNSKWLPLYKYIGKYYLYIPCDRMNDGKYLIDDNTIQISSSEITDYDIDSLEKQKNSLIIKYSEPNSKMEFNLTIIPIDKKKGIYKFITYQEKNHYEVLMLNTEYYKNYDIIVNECIDSKITEFKFDK
ncbi:hypothetical protein ASG22_16955 [Chryseobacterium sp. Leaf405]|uniref:hypothetical protein n=1 Tax=Chryseobacterium sp. Leaf405 TaxID=1736367 RepID=UPI0006F90DE8|nr:hypothetical protein [Chryseobacterium sp. Leaf405]KQT20663.1 hypothetical protein ASG22_16955 [Chryseobacterium sp. Leaf405]